MLTKRQNFLETIHGGNPDRFVNRFEAFGILRGDPVSAASPRGKMGEEWKTNWGVTIRYAVGTPGPFPVHDDEHKVIKDITKWRDVVKAPSLDYPEEEWLKFAAARDGIDTNEQFVTLMCAPGIFEQAHYLMGIDDCLINFYEEPEEMHALIDYITDWKVEYAKLQCKYFRPELIFHHDDWGTQTSSFMSPDMFNEFIAPAFKRLYSTYKENGVQIIVHHSDSYAANLVPSMIDMGIDVFQGCLTENNVPELIEKYGGKISFMGDINNGVVDVEDWTEELIAREVERACRECGKLYFIPCTTMGGPMSIYPGVYDEDGRQIDRMNKIMF